MWGRLAKINTWKFVHKTTCFGCNINKTRNWLRYNLIKYLSKFITPKKM
jgi:hypothetical protein